MPIQLSGSLVITGSITTTGVITMSGSIASASYSSNSDLLQGTGSVGFTTTASFNAVSSSQQQISSSYIALSASYNTFSGSASTRVTKIENNYATTGSNSFRADQSITGSLVVSSTITAQTLVVQTVTSSILYSSGSNIFGNQLANTQTFTGSVNITGSLALAGNITGNAITLTGALSGTSTSFSGNGLFGGSTNAGNAATFTVSVGLAGTTAGGIQLWAATNQTHFIQFGDGTASADNYRGYIAYAHGTDSLILGTASTDRLTITSTGNLGLGVTPSAWSIVTPVMQISTGGGFIGGQGSANVIRVGVNTYFSGTNWTYINSDYASWSETSSGAFYWFNAPSGTSGGTFTPTKLMSLYSTGNLGINTASDSGYKLDVNGTGRFSDKVFLNTTLAYTSELNVQAIANNRPAIKAGYGGVSGNGYWILGDNYTTDESLMAIGVDYSSGGLVLGSALAPSTTTSGAFISTQAQFGGYGSAIRLGTSGDIVFYNGTQNSVIAAGSAKTASVALTIAQTGVPTFTVSGNDTRLANFSTVTYGSARGLRINSYQSSNGGQDCAIEFDSGVAGYGGFKLSNSGTPMLTLVATGAATFSSTITLPNNTYLQFNNSSGTARTVLTVDASNTTVIRHAASGGYFALQNFANTVNNLLIADSGAATFSSGIAIGGATATTGGIQFPATAVAIADGNNLDDYEEGTWTPTLTTSGGTPPTVVSSSGRYIIIGKLVTIYFKFLLSSASGGSGQLKITNAPFSLNLSTIPAVGFARITDLGLTLNCGFLTGTVINFNKYDGNYAGTDYETVGQVSYYND